MPSIPSESGNEPTEWQRALLLKASSQQRVPTEISQQTQRQVERALDIQSSILGKDSQDLPNAAHRLAARHQEHFIAPQFVSILLRLMQDKKDQAAWQELKLIRMKANESGFFIMKYTPEMMKQRLLSPNFVIAEASGKHPDPDHSYHAISVPAADCQCWIPDATEKPQQTLTLPKEKDVIYESGFVEDCIQRPWAYGEVADISSNAAMNNKGLAGAARSAAFEYIQNVVNPTRGDYPIEYMGAEIGMLKGIVLPDGTQIRLEDMGDPEGVKNERSLGIHFHLTSKPASHGYILKNRIVPVEYNGENYGILTNWLMAIHKLKKSA